MPRAEESQRKVPFVTKPTKLLCFMGLLVCGVVMASLLTRRGTVYEPTSTVSAATTLTKLEKIAVPDSETSEKGGVKNWQIAYNKAVDLNNQGKLTDASYYFSNALGMSPGNITIIDAYYKVMLSLSRHEGKNDNVLYDITLLQIVEGFLQSQIPLVATDYVETILTMLADVRTKMEVSGTTIVEDNPQFDTALETIEDGTFFVPTDSPEKIAATLAQLGELREYAAAKKKDTDLLQKKLNTLVAESENALEFYALAEILQGRKDSVRSSMSKSPAVAEYQLQECEQCLRQMISLPTTYFNTKITDEFAALQKIAQEVADAKGAEAWQKLVIELDKIKSERQKTTIPDWYSKKGRHQVWMECLQKEMALLQSSLPMLSGEKNLEYSIKRLRELNAEAVEIGNNQSQAYNTWAIGKIKTCLQKAKGGVGTFANGEVGRKTIGSALIEELGPIDRRFLTSEVSRSFEEVMNKYLAPNQLNPVKTEKDLNEEGTILYTLNQMHETDKRPLSDF